MAEVPKHIPQFSAGQTVRVWPGTLEGRSAITTTVTGTNRLGSVYGVFVRASADENGRRTPGGFYAATHVEVIDAD